MTWLVWRQHRGEAVFALAVVAILALLVLSSWLHLHSAAGTIAEYACNTFPLPVNPAPECLTARNTFGSTGGTLAHILPLFNIFPLLFGVFIGAPLIAREMEEGTWRLAWAQSVTRTRWMRYQLGGAGIVTVLGAGLFAVTMMWWLSPSDYAVVSNRFAANAFDFYGPIPVAWALLALALGVLAGAIIRRIIPAMAATLVAFAAVRFPIEWLRPHYLPPHMLWNVKPGMTIPVAPNNWILGDPQVVAPGGHQILSPDEVTQLHHAAGTALPQYLQYLQQHGYTWVFTYQPGDRFWLFQSIETAICLGLAIAAVVVARRLVLRRLG